MVKKITFEEYAKKFPLSTREKLKELKGIIRFSLPNATEGFSYGVPAFIELKKTIIMYGAFKNHLGIYPTPSVIKYFEKELKGYNTSEGAIQFPLDKPLPKTLIKKIILYRKTNLN